MPQMSAEGEGLFTGGTRRADGSYRKVVRVRPGYVPQEEVPKYVPEQRRVRDAPPTHHFTIVSSASRATESSVEPPKPKPAKEKKPKDTVAPASTTTTTAGAAAVDPAPIETDPTKRARNIQKKIRQIEELQVSSPSKMLAFLVLFFLP
eukprot:m.669134 g.669134  ORF g.669134 m.669134 type:complete len:149 (+) comp58519_c0_seq60:45-491(+)